MAQLKQQSPDIDSLGTISACGAPQELPEASGYIKVQQSHDVIQVAVIEADEKTRVKLRMDLRVQSGIEVASEATNAETGLVLLESIDVDVAVVDGTLPDVDPVKFIRIAQKAQANSYITASKILVLVTLEQRLALSATPKETVLLDAIAARADAFCLRDAPIERLANAVKITHRDGTYQDPAIVSLLEPVVTVW